VTLPKDRGDREHGKFRDSGDPTETIVAVTLEGFSPALTGHSTANNQHVAVGTTSTEILAANTNRKMAVFFNNSGSSFYLRLGGTAEVNKGIRLGPNEIYQIGLVNLWLGAVNAIRASGTSHIDVFEGT
jgi:hypothetical protein